MLYNIPDGWMLELSGAPARIVSPTLSQAQTYSSCFTFWYTIPEGEDTRINIYTQVHMHTGELSAHRCAL